MFHSSIFLLLLTSAVVAGIQSISLLLVSTGVEDDFISGIVLRGWRSPRLNGPAAKVLFDDQLFVDVAGEIRFVLRGVIVGRGNGHTGFRVDMKITAAAIHGELSGPLERPFARGPIALVPCIDIDDAVRVVLVPRLHEAARICHLVLIAASRSEKRQLQPEIIRFSYSTILIFTITTS